MITDFNYYMEFPHTLLTSANNPGAAEAAEKLAASMENVSHSPVDESSELSFEDALVSILGDRQATKHKTQYGWLTRVQGIAWQLRSPGQVSAGRESRVMGAEPRPNCQMVVYLNEQAFAQGPRGDALADDVRAAMDAGVAMLVLHERKVERGALPFDHFYQITPETLVRRGLYRQLATPWYHGQHARVSRAVAAGAMGASRKVRRAVHERRARPKRGSSAGDKIAPAPEPEMAPVEKAVQPVSGRAWPSATPAA